MTPLLIVAGVLAVCVLLGLEGRRSHRRSLERIRTIDPDLADYMEAKRGDE